MNRKLLYFQVFISLLREFIDPVFLIRLEVSLKFWDYGFKGVEILQIIGIFPDIFH